jgi:hypothetical protein
MIRITQTYAAICNHLLSVNLQQSPPHDQFSLRTNIHRQKIELLINCMTHPKTKNPHFHGE